MMLPYCLVAFLLVPQGSEEVAWLTIGRARESVRRGMLAEAESALEGIERRWGDSVEAHRELLLANILYERGRYEAAESRYATSLNAFRAVGDQDGAAVAESNRSLCLERLSLLHSNDQRLLTLKVISMAVLGLAVTIITAIGRRVPR